MLFFSSQTKASFTHRFLKPKYVYKWVIKPNVRNFVALFETKYFVQRFVVEGNVSLRFTISVDKHDLILDSLG